MKSSFNFYFLISRKGVALLSILFALNTISFAQMEKSIDFSNHKVKFDKVKGDDGIEYQKVLYDENRTNDEPGKPQLPVKYIS